MNKAVFCVSVVSRLMSLAWKHLSEGLGRLGVASVLAEGGPTLNGQLAAANVLDELCLTLAPYLASGDSKRILAGRALGVPARVRVASLLEDEGVLFLRARPEA